jgi:FkbM family methyltransferase
MSHRASTVHAFEPNPAVYAYLSRIRVRSVYAHQIALSNTEGTASLYQPDEWRSGRATIAVEKGESIATVATRTLDSFQLKDVGFMKVDVEGHEEAVLQGAVQTLEAWHPTLLVEIEERHNPGALMRIPHALQEHGYGYAYFLSGGGLAPLATFDVQRNQLDVAEGADTASSMYANNFVFATAPLT